MHGHQEQDVKNPWEIGCESEESLLKHESTNNWITGITEDEIDEYIVIMPEVEAVKNIKGILGIFWKRLEYNVNEEPENEGKE